MQNTYANLGDMAEAAPESDVSPHAAYMLHVGLNLLGQAHGQHLANVIKGDIASNPLGSARAMALMAAGDKRFREALADNGHAPDAYSLLLQDAANYPNSGKTVLGQLIDIFL